jgi:hypothetical protein
MMRTTLLAQASPVLVGVGLMTLFLCMALLAAVLHLRRGRSILGKYLTFGWAVASGFAAVEAFFYAMAPELFAAHWGRFTGIAVVGAILLTVVARYCGKCGTGNHSRDCWSHEHCPSCGERY